MAPMIRLAATLTAVVGLALGETIDWQQVDAAGPATGFELAPQADPVANYTTPAPLGDASIRAPLDCKNQDTYLGQKIFADGPLSTSRCADACTAQRAYDAQNAGGKKPCRFFNTYMLQKVTKGDPAKGVPTVSTPAGQVCSLYTETWPASYATDKGQWRGDTLYVISDSWSASNAADRSSGNCPTTTAKPVVTPPPGMTTKTVTTTTTTSK